MGFSTSRSSATSEEALISYDTTGEPSPGARVLAPEQRQSRSDSRSIPSSSATFSLSNSRIRPSKPWTESFSRSNSSRCLSVRRHAASSLPVTHLSSVSSCLSKVSLWRRSLSRLSFLQNINASDQRRWSWYIAKRSRSCLATLTSRASRYLRCKLPYKLEEQGRVPCYPRSRSPPTSDPPDTQRSALIASTLPKAVPICSSRGAWREAC